MQVAHFFNALVDVANQWDANGIMFCREIAEVREALFLYWPHTQIGDGNGARRVDWT